MRNDYADIKMVEGMYVFALFILFKTLDSNEKKSSCFETDSKKR